MPGTSQAGVPPQQMPVAPQLPPGSLTPGSLPPGSLPMAAPAAPTPGVRTITPAALQNILDSNSLPGGTPLPANMRVQIQQKLAMYSQQQQQAAHAAALAAQNQQAQAQGEEGLPCKG